MKFFSESFSTEVRKISKMYKKYLSKWLKTEKDIKFVTKFLTDTQGMEISNRVGGGYEYLNMGREAKNMKYRKKTFAT